MMMEKELLQHIELLAWDVNTTDTEKVRGIQNLLYQYSANCDNRSDMMFGDEEAHVDSPNMRRC